MEENKNAMKPSETVTRRDFIKVSAASAGIAALVATGNYAFAQGSGRLKVGMVGCGGRGTGAASDCLTSSEGVELVAMGDTFKDRLEGAKGQLKGFGEKFKVKDDKCFIGFDAYKKVLECDIDLIILATPPGFRPIHFRAAIDAGKNVFMEKPVAVDGAGVRAVLEVAEKAAQKKLAVVSGTQRRHETTYLECMKRIHDGAIGTILQAQCYWNQGGLWNNGRKQEWSDMEWQIRNWLYFTWLSGDHIVEQHIHNLDVMNWVMQGHPEKCTGMGGRQVRTDPSYGHIFDHFAIEYFYPGGARVMSMCRQQDNTASYVGENVIGTKGTSNCNTFIKGENPWRFEGKKNAPYVQEHADLIASIRKGEPLNEGKRVAESTLTAIMGRMSCYTGQEITWQMALNSQEVLMPGAMDWGNVTVPPVAMPGRTAFK